MMFSHTAQLFRVLFRTTCAVKPISVGRKLSSSKLLHSKYVIGNDTDSSQDILLENIKSSTDTSDILYSVKKHLSIMNNRHLIQVFRSIFHLQKADNSGMSNGEVLQSYEFQKLCSTLKSQAHLLDSTEVIDVLKTMSYVGVRANTKIVQILLQIVTKQVNDMSLEQLTFLDFLIKDFAACPLVEALKIALPIVFEAVLKTKIEHNNVTHLTSLFHYAARKNLSVATSDLIIECLMKNRLNIDFKSGKSIVRSICDLQVTNESHRLLLHQGLDILVDNYDRCTYNDFDVILSKLANKYSHKNFYFYHEEFVNCAIQFIINNEQDLEEGVWILRKALRFGHVNIKLLEYLAKKAESNLNVLAKCGTVILFSFVGGFAQADFRPNNWSILEPVILKNASTHFDQIQLPWLKFAIDLCTLDCWPIDIFKLVFNKEFLATYLARDYNMLDYLQLLNLFQAVSILCPWYNGPKAPQKFLDQAINFNGTNVLDFPLKNSLIRGLGSDGYVLNGVYSKLGHFIDHVMIMRKGGYPVAVIQRNDSEHRIYVEDLAVPDDCKIIAVLYLPARAYCINTEKLKGQQRLIIDSLEIIGPTVLPVSSIVWEQLPEHEKIPYIMRAVREKCDVEKEEHNVLSF